MPKGIIAAELYTVRWYTNTMQEVAETLKKIADIGYTAIEPAHSHEDPMGKMDPKEVAKLVKDNGLTVISAHWPWDRFLSDLDAIVDEMVAYDCKRPVISGTTRAKYVSEDGFKQFLDELGPVTERLAQAGMILTYHHPFQYFCKVGDRLWFELLYEQTDADTLLFQVDTFWVQHAGADPIVWIKKLAGREEILHYKDMTCSPEGQQRFAEVGEGNLNLPGILDAAEQSGVKWCVVEQDEFYGRDPFESLAMSYRNLKAKGLS